MEEKSIAMEMLQELKTQNNRLAKANKNLFILCIILIISIVVLVIAGLVYESQYETFGEETIYTQEAENSDNSSINQNIK